MIPAREKSDVVLSIVLPVRDAQAFVEETVREIDGIARDLFYHYEIVVVDDASRDATVEVIEQLQKSVPNLQMYCLNIRSGIEVALTVGLDSSIGDFVITANAETDPLDLLPLLWKKSEEGHEFVCGIRQEKGSWNLRTILRRIFSRTFEATTGLRIPPGASHFRLYSRRIVTYLTRSNDRHLLIDVLPFFSSHKVETFTYSPIDRGNSFRQKSLADDFIRGITILLSSSVRPLRFVTVLALLASSLSLLFAVWVLAVALFRHHVVEGWISLALPMAIIFFLMSTMLGIMSEYIYMMAQRSGNRPIYSIVKESTSTILHARKTLNVVDNWEEQGQSPPERDRMEANLSPPPEQL